MTPMQPSQAPLYQTTLFAPSAALALLPFEAALFVVSNYLAEARMATDALDVSRARKCYAAAEACAVQTGYVEIMQLVWGDTENSAPLQSLSRPPLGAAFSPL